MNIGLDLRPSLVRPTGVGSYVLALAQRLPRLAPEHRFFYFSASFKDRYPERDWPEMVTDVPPKRTALPSAGVNVGERSGVVNGKLWNPVARVDKCRTTTHRGGARCCQPCD